LDLTGTVDYGLRIARDVTDELPANLKCSSGKVVRRVLIQHSLFDQRFFGRFKTFQNNSSNDASDHA